MEGATRLSGRITSKAVFRKFFPGLRGWVPLLLLLLSSHSGEAQPAALSIAQPAYGFNVLPGSTRRLFATMPRDQTGQLQWKVISGTATLASQSDGWVDVVAPPEGASCSIHKDGEGYRVSSAVQFTIEARLSAQSGQPDQVASVAFHVCKPEISVTIVPFYRTLYSGQQADVQSLVWGSVNSDVTWTIAAQPAHGDGALSDTAERDTVFSATQPGRYTLRATSAADPRRSAPAIMYVTGHPMPRRVTPNHTEPVDCSVDPELHGKVYEVGPSQALKTLSAVPQADLRAGSTIRVHNEDTTGEHPTTYHEYVQLQGQGAAAQPIRICGVPDRDGHLPVLDEDQATGRPDTSRYAAGYGGITIHTEHAFATYPDYHAARYIIIEGLKVQNAKAVYGYVGPNGKPEHWIEGSACIRIAQVQHAVLIGNELANCGNGAFSGFNANAGWGGANLFTLWEGNYLHDNGTRGSYLEHQLYLQGWGQVAQFNRIDSYAKGAQGSNWKSRGLWDIYRYNYIGPGAARDLDLVDVEDARPYMSFEAYLGRGPKNVQPFKSIYGTDGYTADMLAAAQEVWHSHFVYGNIFETRSQVPIHFSMDHEGREVGRLGSLFFYNNTFYELTCQRCTGELWTLFDTTAGGGNFATQIEWQNVAVYNNVIWMGDSRRPVFQWNNYAPFIATVGKNLLPEGWGSNDFGGANGSGWSVRLSGEGFEYPASQHLAAHLRGFSSSNLLTSAAMPFDPATWLARKGTPLSEPLPPPMREMPVRFQFTPAVGYPVPRRAVPTLGATDAE
jgi:hypothetical protein